MIYEPTSYASTFRPILDALPANTAVIDSHGFIVEVNARWRAFGASNGRPPHAHDVGANYLGLCEGFPGDGIDPEHVRDGLIGVLRGARDAFTIVYPCHGPNVQRWFQLTAAPLDVGAGRGALVMHLDVTDRELAHLRAEQNEAHYRLLFEGNPFPMWVYDTETLAFLAVNRAACDHYGYTRDAFLAMTIEEIRPPEELKRLHELLPLSRMAPVRGARVRHQRNDGSLLDVEITSEPLLFQGREARLVLARDIGEQVRAEATLAERRRLEDELLRKQRLESLGSLAGGIAHDLNNVLAPIFLSLDELKEVAQDGAVRETVEMLEICSRRGADLLRHLLSFARGASGPKQLVDLAALAAELERFIRETFPRGFHVVVDAAPGLWRVDGNPTQLHQVLLNLCVNARDAMGEMGRLEVRADNVTLDEVFSGMHGDLRPGPYVRIVVTDSGPGVPGDVVPHLFEPFFTTKESTGGTGLGLPTALMIVREHGGLLRLVPDDRTGATFEVWLPAVAEATAEVAVTASHGDLDGCGETVLIVDDEPSVRMAMKTALERRGYRPLEAANGAEGVSMFARFHADISLVIVDMAMPVMDGRATLAALRAMDPGVKLLVTSGLADTSLDRGVPWSDYLEKPFTARELLGAVRALIDTDAGMDSGLEGTGREG